MAANILTWEIFLILTLKGKGHLKQLRDHCANANEVNRELLMRIIRDNQDIGKPLLMVGLASNT